MQRGKHHPARIVSIAGLEEDDVDRAIFILCRVGAERLTAGDEILDCGLVQIVAADIPLLEMHFGDVCNGAVAVDGICNAQPGNQRGPDDMLIGRLG